MKSKSIQEGKMKSNIKKTEQETTLASPPSKSSSRKLKYFAKLISMEGEPPKLYLCTRDIKVGDKDLRIDGAPYNSTLPVLDNLDLEALKEYNAFKVIGEISPEAIWVKDGDQFKDYQLWWLVIEHNVPFMKFVEGDKFEEKYPGKFKLVTKVKCHCCETYK